MDLQSHSRIGSYWVDSLLRTAWLGRNLNHLAGIWKHEVVAYIRPQWNVFRKWKFVVKPKDSSVGQCWQLSCLGSILGGCRVQAVLDAQHEHWAQQLDSCLERWSRQKNFDSGTGIIAKIEMTKVVSFFIASSLYTRSCRISPDGPWKADNRRHNHRATHQCALGVKCISARHLKYHLVIEWMLLPFCDKTLSKSAIPTTTMERES